MKGFIQSISIILLLLTVQTFAQTGKVSGVVKDSRTGEPLIGANVIIEGTSLGAATNIDGFYAILNVPPGTYTVKASVIGYNPSVVKELRVNIDQTSELNMELSETAIETAEIVVIAETPIVQKDVAASRVNLNVKEIENMPVVKASSIIGLQAGIQSGANGPLIRGSSADQAAFMVNGLILRDERDNNPITGISFTAIEDIQITTGGFNAEYGNVRSGVVNAVTKEGRTDRYSVSFIGRYSAPAKKHFGPSANSFESYWIRPYLDNAVAWTGTENGAWDEYTQRQYPKFEGWVSIAEKTLQNADPNDDLTPEAAQQLFLWQFRRVIDIEAPDFDYDMTIAGPVPQISRMLGNLRFSASFRASNSEYMIPLATNGYRDWTAQFKVTSDVAQGMKLSLEGLLSQEKGTNISRSGLPGLFMTSSQIADNLDNGEFTNSRIFSPDYFSPSVVNRNMFGAKFTHVLNATTFYEFSVNRVGSAYDTNPTRARDTSRIYLFGNKYYASEAPYGFQEEPSSESATGINGLRYLIGFGNSRDTSRVATYTTKFDFVTQLDKFNEVKTGFEFVYGDNNVNYGAIDKFLPTSQMQSVWHKNPIRGALYAQDKLEFEGMIANIGLRLDYFNAGGEWYEYDPYNKAFTAENSAGLDTMLARIPTEKLLNLSPRLAVAFPISVNSKLYFNYGHTRQTPDPNNIYLVRRPFFTKAVSRIGNPNNPLQKTIQYELGYEHNLFDQLLLHVAGYYKDISLQPQLVQYVSRDSKVSYYVSEPNSYADTRGFEVQLNKNRGNWVQGFVNYTYRVGTSGFFGFEKYFQNATEQRKYEKESRDAYQEKPIPQPFARLNLDFFTPSEFGPQFGGINPLGDWRLNLLAAWSSGSFTTWVGGGTIPGVQYNVQWVDYYGLDIRLSKSFRVGPANIQFFMDVNNILNNKYMNDYAWFDGEDRKAYFNSLQLPEDAFADFPKKGDGTPQIPWSNTTDPSYYEFGDDRPGDYRKGEYIPWDPNASEADKAKWRENKSYIDMPNQNYITFLNPRDIFFGLRVNFEIF